MIKLRVVVVLLHYVGLSLSYNILAVFPHEGKSHQWIFYPIVRELVRRGHSLTALVHYEYGIKSEGYREIILNDPEARGKDVFELDIETPVWYDQLRSPDLLFDEGLSSCNIMFSNAKVKKLLQSNEKFDLIFGELFNSECSQGLALRYGAPLVAISTTTIMPWHNGHFGNPDNPSFIPNNHIWFGNRMGFSDKVINFLGTIYAKTMYWIFFDSNKKLLEEHLNRKITNLDGLIRNTSLLLVNSHWSLTFARPLVPAVVEIGGVHVQKAKKLPEVRQFYS